jgi:hypothetical protein
MCLSETMKENIGTNSVGVDNSRVIRAFGQEAMCWSNAKHCYCFVVRSGKRRVAATRQSAPAREGFPGARCKQWDRGDRRWLASVTIKVKAYAPQAMP